MLNDQRTKVDETVLIYAPPILQNKPYEEYQDSFPGTSEIQYSGIVKGPVSLSKRHAGKF